MNNPLDRVERLAATARRETAPAVDVTRPVMARLSEPAPADDRAFSWVAALSAAAAAVLLLSLVPEIEQWREPAATILASLSWGLL